MDHPKILTKDENQKSYLQRKIDEFKAQKKAEREK